MASNYYQPLQDYFKSFKMVPITEFCQFMENLEAADKSSPVECLCQTVLKNK